MKAEAKLKGLVGTTPKVSRAKLLNAGKEVSTADVDQALKDYMNEQRKEAPRLRKRRGHEQAAGDQA